MSLSGLVPQSVSCVFLRGGDYSRIASSGEEEDLLVNLVTIVVVLGFWGCQFTCNIVNTARPILATVCIMLKA